MAMADLPPLPLPDGVTENQVDCTSSCGLSFHILESGYDPTRQRPLILLVHGYPELAFSWRRLLVALADAGYYAVAYDQRGYGRTTGWDDSSWAQTDLKSFEYMQLTRDALALVSALGYEHVKCIIGHDFGAVTTDMCALMRPDVFRSCITMSHPPKMLPKLPFETVQHPPVRRSQKQSRHSHQLSGQSTDVHKAMAELPVPRKHYKWYNSTPSAAGDWLRPAQGLKSFLRGYFHLKSADWSENKPFPLREWSAAELAKMPGYYIMPYHLSMPETIAKDMQGEDDTKTTRWLSDEELDVYVQEWSRTGFQGGLNWYRSGTSPVNNDGLALFSGKKIEVPSLFVSGASDWGNYQEPGVIEKLSETCSDFRGVKMIPGAGHWVQQEQSEAVAKEVIAFLQTV